MKLIDDDDFQPYSVISYIREARIKLAPERSKRPMRSLHHSRVRSESWESNPALDGSKPPRTPRALIPDN